MALEDSGKAPYAPADSVLTIISKYRDHGLTAPFNADVLSRAGVSESLVPRTLAALRQLDLIDDDGKPLESLDGLQRVPSGELQAAFASWVRSVYAPIFRFVDPATATPEQIEDAFRGYEPKGQRARMVTLFIGLCEHAGIVEKDQPRRRSTTRRPTSRAPEKKIVIRSPATQTKPATEGGQVPAPQVSGLDAAKAKYVDLLMNKLAEQEVPDPELLDRIERALGISGGGTS